MSHLKMDKFGNVCELGFNGGMGVDEINPQILAAYAQPVNSAEGTVANPIIIREVAAPIAAAPTSGSAVNPPTTGTVKNLGSWLKSIFASKPVLFPQSDLSIQPTKSPTGNATEYTISAETMKTPGQGIMAIGQTVLKPFTTPGTKFRGLSRAAQVKAIAEARKSGKVTGKALTAEEKQVLTRHPFSDYN